MAQREVPTIRARLPPGLLAVPIVGAPLAGGPTTPELAAAVCEAGGLGFLAAGYKVADALGADIEALRGLTERPFGVNVFYPVREQIDEAQVAAYVDPPRRRGRAVRRRRRRATMDRHDWEAKLELLRREQPAVISFTFGCPSRDAVTELQAAGRGRWGARGERSPAGRSPRHPGAGGCGKPPRPGPWR